MEKYPRLLVVAKEFNVGRDTLLDFLKSKKFNIKDIRDTTSLSKEMYDAIKTEMLVKNINPIILEQKEEVVFLTKNIFTTICEIVKYKNFPLINSHFTNEQAINICSRMSNSYCRNLCKQIETKQVDKNLILYQLHFIADKAIKVFGGKILTFITTLRQLKFKNDNAKEIYDYKKMNFDLIPDFPIITFKLQDDSFKIAFFAKKDKASNKTVSDIRVFSSNRKQIGYINEEGYIFHRLENITPHLSLFAELGEQKEIQLYSGVETGKCDFCPRTLTHPTSLRTGIGPICAKKRGIDRNLYIYDLN